MARVIKECNFRVEVSPRGRGDFGFASIGGLQWTPEDELRICKNIEADIRRHVYDIGRTDIVFDSEEVCEYCDADWSEGDSPHNGGCCQKDIEIMEEMEKDHD